MPLNDLMQNLRLFTMKLPAIFCKFISDPLSAWEVIQCVFTVYQINNGSITLNKNIGRTHPRLMQVIF